MCEYGDSDSDHDVERSEGEVTEDEDDLKKG